MTKNQRQICNYFGGISGIVLGLLSLSLWANTEQTEEVPPPLQPWVNWVLHETQDYTCPFNYNQAPPLPSGSNAISPRQKGKFVSPVEKGGGICRWPSHLTLNVNSTQAEFSQQWQIYGAGWIALPGNAKHWPQQVKINDEVALVADRGGVPSVFAPKGPVTIRGQFDWQQHPAFLSVPANTGLVALTVDNTPVTIPALDEQGRLWLRQRGASADSEAAEENRLDLRVYRHIIDDIPLQLITRIELDVAGRHREVILGPVMLDKHQAMFLDSRLPARLETDGRLRLQVRPGSWTLILRTRQQGAPNQITLAPSKGQWVDEEVWVFEARNDLRLVEVRGVTAIDPQQTALPPAWRKFPAYQVKAKDTLELVEKRRGDPDPVPDQLQLKRHFWLDFDGEGYSVQDRISGTMTRGWRLEMAEPAVLGRVAVNGQDQFITRLKEGGNTGVEVRRGQIDLVADSRLEDTLNQVPAVGWAHDFQQVSATLHLPPGWRLLNATGADDVPDTWLKQWTLLDLFIVLIIAAAVAKLWHWGWGVLTLFTMVLIYREPDAMYWFGFWFLFLNIIASLALLRVLPALGWFSRLVRSYRNICLITLLIIALPFMIQQMRQSIYPQLERPWAQLNQSTAPTSTVAYDDYNIDMAGEAQMRNEEIDGLNLRYGAAAKSDEEFPANAVQAPMRMQERQSFNARYGSAATEPKKQLRQIDPHAQVQTGPGLPQWEWDGIGMSWSGPVKQTQSVHLWLLSPAVNSVLGVMRVVLLSILIVLFLWLSWGQRAQLLLKSRTISLTT
ncbi:MAG: hypothetical protein DRR19_19485, partial [Candidatus Parabeggiatoa sp. nov. 1]